MPTITAARAARHEALHPRLTALEQLVAPIAGRKPELAVPAPVLQAARGLLGAARELLGRRWPTPRFDDRHTNYATLAVLLGQARVALESFESDHSAWDESRKCRCWRLAAGGPLPVRRLLPPGPPPVPEGPSPEGERLRQLLIKRMMASRDDAYDEGYRDALAGRPAQDQPYQTRERAHAAAAAAANRQDARESARVIPVPRLHT